MFEILFGNIYGLVIGRGEGFQSMYFFSLEEGSGFVVEQNVFSLEWMDNLFGWRVGYVGGR